MNRKALMAAPSLPEASNVGEATSALRNARRAEEEYEAARTEHRAARKALRGTRCPERNRA